MSQRPEKSRLYTAWAVCGFLLLAVALVFGQTLRHEFVNCDDQEYVSANLQVIPGLTAQGIAWAFTTNHTGNWLPLTWFSHMLDCQFYGLHAGGHHLTNVLLHAAVAILLFLVLWRMTGDLWPSALVATVFAIHPLRAESVAWVAERKDVLSGLFFVLTLGAYVGYVRRQFSIVRYLAVMVLFALGLMAKPMLVTLPFVLLLLDYWPLGRMSPQQWRRLVVEKVPLLALAAASCAAATLAQSNVGAVAQLEVLPLSTRIANALVSYVAYLGQFFYPFGLAAYYPHPGVVPIWKTVGAFMVLAGISAAALAWRRRFPHLCVGWFWYLGMLVPVIGLIQVGSQAMADRYTYLPQIGLCIALVWFLNITRPELRHFSPSGNNVALIGVQRIKSFCCRYPHHCNGGTLCVASALVLAALMCCAWRQTSLWCNSKALWTHALAYTSRSALAHYSLATALAGRGRIDEAIAHYQKALEIDPRHARAYNNLANVLAGSGRIDEAIAHYQKALKIKPDYANAHANLGVTLTGRGRIDEAVVHYRKALEINPNCVNAHYSLGNILANRGRIDEAIAHFRKVLEIKPDHAYAHHNLGIALAEGGRIDEAIAHFRRVLEIKPDHADARYNIGVVLSERERILKALAGRRESLRSNPNDVALLNDTAWLLATNPNASLRNGPQAVELAQRAAKLSGGQQPAILDTLAAAYAEAGRFPEAVQTARKALELAGQQNKQTLVKSIRAKIQLYEAGTPFREK